MSGQDVAFSLPLTLSPFGIRHLSCLLKSARCPESSQTPLLHARRTRYMIYSQATPPSGGDSSTGGSPPGGPPSGGKSSGGNQPGGAPEPPDGATLTQALELSFRNVWIRLMTSGVGKEYSDAILAFVIATMAAYKAGYSINALKLELSANEKATVGYMGRDVSLNEQEKQTRLIWIILVYLTLAKTKMVTERPVPSIRSELSGTNLEELLSGLIALVDNVFEAEGKGYTLETFKMELAMQKSPGEENQLTQAQANIRSQWSRIVFATLKILPDNLKR